MNNIGAEQGIIYVHVNHVHQFVLSSGILLQDFLKGIPFKLPNLLLLRHPFEDVHFNMHTMFEYADSEMIAALKEENFQINGELCWIDFSNEEILNRLSGQEIAELLYLAHLKNHLKLPFYKKLNNQFVYLTTNDGLLNKIYFKSWEPFYTMLGTTIASKLNQQRDVSLFRRWKRKPVPPIPSDVLYPFINLMKEGVAMPISKAIRGRQFVEIPVWIVGDFINVDTLFDECNELFHKKKPDGKIVFNRKSGEWQAFANYPTQ